MDENLANILDSLAAAVITTAVFAGALVWLTIFVRLVQRRPLIHFSPRRLVPWNGLDILGILLGYVCLGGLVAFAAQDFLGWDFSSASDGAKQTTQENLVHQPEQHPADATDSEDDLDRAHPVVVLLTGDSSPATLLLCLFTVVVMAPLAEEFFFRLLLQGFLEKIDYHGQRAWRYSGRLLGLMPILLSSLLFAAMHAREPQMPRSTEHLVRLFAVDSLLKVVLLVGAVTYLKAFRGATWKDLGLRFDTFWTDAGLAVVAYSAVIVPVYALQETLARLLPNTVPDPFPLFFFAVALGYLYFRTHRLMPAILLHFLFNATAIGMFFATM